MFVTNWISPTKIQKISEITNFFRHYFLSRTEVIECAHLYRIVQSKIHETHEILQYSCIPWILLCYLIKNYNSKTWAERPFTSTTLSPRPLT